jgi:hypothetical protein
VKKPFTVLSIVSAVSAIISACAGLFYSFDGTRRIVENIYGQPMEIIDVYTTEPTFVIDLAIILPSVLYCGIALMKKKKAAYQLAPMFLTLLTGVGACVIFQTVMQTALGIVLEPGQRVSEKTRAAPG